LNVEFNAAGGEHSVIERQSPLKLIVVAVVGVLLIVVSALVVAVARQNSQLLGALGAATQGPGAASPPALAEHSGTSGTSIPVVLPEACSAGDAAAKGETLAYSDANGVYLVVVEAGAIAEGPCLVATGMGDNLVWSGDGTMLSWSSGDAARFYTRREASELGGPTGLPADVSVARSPTGFLALGDRQVWRLTRANEHLDAQAIGSIPKAPEAVTWPSALSLAGSTSDGQPIAIVRDGVGANGRGPTELWTIDRDGHARRVGPSADENGNWTPSAAVDPKGHNVAFVWGEICGNACAAENWLDIYDQQTGALVAHVEAPPVPEHSVFLFNAVAYGLDGSLIVGGSAYPDGSKGHPFFAGANGDQHLYRVEGAKMVETGRAASSGETSARGQLAMAGQFAALSNHETLAAASADGKTTTKITDSYFDFEWAPDLPQ
jgi:hypothetical protein